MEVLKRLCGWQKWLDEERPKIFALAQRDLLEGFADDVEKRAEELAKQKLAQLLSIVDESLIVAIDARTKQVFIGGEKADEGRLGNLRSEAQFLLESDLWKVIYETPKQLAHKAMFVDDGKLDTQLLKGRAILYTLATQEKIVNLFKSLSTAPSTSA